MVLVGVRDGIVTSMQNSTCLKEVPKEWFVPSDMYGVALLLRVFVPLLFLIVLTPRVSTAAPLYLVLLAPVFGVYIYKLTIVMHECCHSSLFKSRVANKWVGRLAGAFVGTNFEVFQQQHMQHHRFNGTEKDIQYQQTLGGLPSARWPMMFFLLKPLLGFSVVEVYFSYFRGNAKKQKKRSSAGWLSGVLATQVVLATVITGFWSQPLLVFFFPICGATFGLFYSRLRTFAEHVEPDGKRIENFTRSHKPSFWDNALINDANFNFHLEHHLVPHLPASNLPKVHELWQSEIHNSETLGSSMFKTIFSKIRNAS